MKHTYKNTMPDKTKRAAPVRHAALLLLSLAFYCSSSPAQSPPLPGGGGGGEGPSPALISGITTLMPYHSSHWQMYNRQALLDGFFFFSSMSDADLVEVRVQETTCEQYKDQLGERKERLSSMPSQTPEERARKRTLALEHLASMKLLGPCKSEQVLIWIDLLRLHATMESLWPELSTEKEFRDAARLSMLHIQSRGAIQKAYIHAWRARILLDFGLYFALNGNNDQALAHYTLALESYKTAERLYLRSDGPDALVRWQMRGYMAEAYLAQHRDQQAYCASKVGADRAPGRSAKARVFRHKMRAISDSLDYHNLADPAGCNRLGKATGQPVNFGEIDYSRFWKYGGTLLLGLFLGAALWRRKTAAVKGSPPAHSDVWRKATNRNGL